MYSAKFSRYWVDRSVYEKEKGRTSSTVIHCNLIRNIELHNFQFWVAQIVQNCPLCVN